jgi:biopolymer transport protein ExbB
MFDDALGQLGEYIRGGGFVMPPLIVGAALLWYAIGYRALTLRRKLIAAAERQGLALAGQGLQPLRRHLDVAFGDVEDELSRFDITIKAIVVVAPLAGLLGTVAGMMETFDALGDMALFSQTGGIAGGISQALLSTQMGLSVAIPGLLVGRMLKRRQRVLELSLERVKDRLCAGLGGGAPA